MYCDGLGIEKYGKNVIRAIKLYKKSIAMGNSLPISNLGIIYIDRNEYHKTIELCEIIINDTIKNNSEFAFCAKAVQHITNTSRSASLWARLYEYGGGVNKNIKKAIELYEKGIGFQCNKLASLIQAMNALPNLYFWNNTATKNIKRCIEVYTIAVNAGNINAAYKLGNIYHTSFYDNMINKYIDLKRYNVTWEIYLHKWFFGDSQQKIIIDQIIVILLLISKNRFSSKYEYVKYYVNGINLNVIKNVIMLK